MNKKDSTFTFFDFDESNIDEDLCSEGEISREEVKKSTCSDNMGNSSLSKNSADKFLTPSKKLPSLFSYSFSSKSKTNELSQNEEDGRQRRNTVTPTLKQEISDLLKKLIKNKNKKNFYTQHSPTSLEKSVKLVSMREVRSAEGNIKS